MILSPKQRFFYRKHPIEFCKRHLNMEPDQNQKPILRALANGKDVSVRSGRGVGKTGGVLAAAILHRLYCYDYCKVPCTAPSRHLLKDNLWGELHKWIRLSNLSKDFEWNTERVSIKGKSGEWWARAITAKEGEGMLGLHSPNLLQVIDEASAVEEAIYDAVDGNLSTPGSQVIMAGNPTRATGRFYDSHHKLRDMYECFKISCYDSSLVDKKYIIKQLKKWGPDSDVFRCHVLGEFPSGDPDTFIPLEKIEGAVNRDDVDMEGDVCVGIDCARYGSNLSVMSFRRSMYVWPLKVWGRVDTQVSVGYVKKHIKDFRKQYEYYGKIKLFIDDVGLGAGVVDPLMHLDTSDCPWMENIEVHRVNAGEKGNEDYANKGTVMWGFVRDYLDDMCIPNDEDLIGQLASRKHKIQPTGRTILESKDDMKRRSNDEVSPDRADALALSFGEFCAEPKLVIY